MVANGFILLFLVVVFVILLAYNQLLKMDNRSSEQRKRSLLKVIIPIVVWTSYVFVMAKSGLLTSVELPPRFPIFLILPLFIFTGVFLYKNRNSALLHSMPKSWPVYFQSFRIAVESLFLAAVGIDMLPYHVTFEGYNMDMLIGLSAPIVGLLVFTLKKLPEWVALVWNYLGLAILASVIFVFLTVVFIPSFWGATAPIISYGMFEFSFMLIPGFLMPVAVFMHILSIIQLSKSKSRIKKTAISAA